MAFKSLQHAARLHGAQLKAIFNSARQITSKAAQQKPELASGTR